MIELIAVCAFPYIIAFTADSIEVRLVINGNLIQSMAMPRLTLITSKNDVFFATTAPEFFSARGRPLAERSGDKDPSPPSSPHCNPSLIHIDQLPTQFNHVDKPTSDVIQGQWNPFESTTSLDLKLDLIQPLILCVRSGLFWSLSCDPVAADSKPFRLYRIQLNNFGSASSCNEACPSTAETTPTSTRASNRRQIHQPIRNIPPDVSLFNQAK